MKCPKCGAELKSGVMFCRECGNKVKIAKPKIRFCRDCGSPLEASSKFCSQCGAKVIVDLSEDIQANRTIIEESKGNAKEEIRPDLINNEENEQTDVQNDLEDDGSNDEVVLGNPVDEKEPEAEQEAGPKPEENYLVPKHAAKESTKTHSKKHKFNYDIYALVIGALGVAAVPMFMFGMDFSGIFHIFAPMLQFITAIIVSIILANNPSDDMKESAVHLGYFAIICFCFYFIMPSYPKETVAESQTISINDSAVSSVSASSEEDTSKVPEKNQKNGFDSDTNVKYQLAQYTFEMPEYWTHNMSYPANNITRWYAENGDRVALIIAESGYDTDESYPVTFEGLEQDTDGMLVYISSETGGTISSYKTVDTGNVKGIWYEYEVNGNKPSHGIWFVFASEDDRNWCYLKLSVTDNSEYQYSDDFTKIVYSIKYSPVEEVASSVSSKAKTSVSSSQKSSSSKSTRLFEDIKTVQYAAFARKNSNYALYYIFDFENDIAYGFATNDTYIDKVSLGGTLKSGYVLYYSEYGFKERFLITSDGLAGTLYDPNGFDWRYERVTDNEAAEELKKIVKKQKS